MSNGCICCTRRDDLLVEIRQLSTLKDRKTGKRRFDVLVVESTGVSDPAAVADAFEDDEEMASLARLDTLVTVVDTAAFGENFASVASYGDTHKAPDGHDHDHTAHKDDAEKQECEDNSTENVIDLLISQVECADVILLNKVDLVTAEQLEVARETVSRLNPHAQVLTTTQSNAPLDKMLLTGLFDYGATTQSATWLQLLRGNVDEEATEAEQNEQANAAAKAQKKTSLAGIGFKNFVYRRQVPFHPGRLIEFFAGNFVFFEPESGADPQADDDEEMAVAAGAVAAAAEAEAEAETGGGGGGGDVTMHVGDSVAKMSQEAKAEATRNSAKFGRILRSKGFVWIATRRWAMGEWSQAGVIGKLECAGPWFCEVPEDNWPDDEDTQLAIRMDFPAGERHKPLESLDPVTSIGDRRQELVFIGIGLDKAKLTAALDACLCTKEEIAAQHAWGKEMHALIAAAKGKPVVPPRPAPMSEADNFADWEDDEE